MTREIYTTTTISTSTTTTVYATGNFFLHTIVLPKATSGAVTFEDVAGSPVTYFVLPSATVAGTLIFDSIFPNGLKVVTAAADTVIINSSQV